MPKNKTHSGTKRKIRLSGSGKLMRDRINTKHYLEHKPSTRTRRLAGSVEVAKSDRKRVRRLLGR